MDDVRTYLKACILRAKALYCSEKAWGETTADDLVRFVESLPVLPYSQAAGELKAYVLSQCVVKRSGTDNDALNALSRAMTDGEPGLNTGHPLHESLGSKIVMLAQRSHAPHADLSRQ